MVPEWCQSYFILGPVLPVRGLNFDEITILKSSGVMAPGSLALKPIRVSARKKLVGD
jgi:hypothetical protein